MRIRSESTRYEDAWSLRDSSYEGQLVDRLVGSAHAFMCQEVRVLLPGCLYLSEVVTYAKTASPLLLPSPPYTKLS